MGRRVDGCHSAAGAVAVAPGGHAVEGASALPVFRGDHRLAGHLRRPRKSLLFLSEPDMG